MLKRSRQREQYDSEAVGAAHAGGGGGGAVPDLPVARRAGRGEGGAGAQRGGADGGAGGGARGRGAGARAHCEYGGEAGPGNWGKLSADLKVCELGLEQTPIDLTSAVRAELGGVEPAFQEMPLAI